MGFLHRPRPWIPFFILVLLVSIIFVYVVNYYAREGTDVYLAFCAFIMATATLCATIIITFLTRETVALTKETLDLSTTDIKARVRPFVSVKEVKGSVSPPPQGTSAYTLSSISIPVQNTGVTPANKLNAHFYLKNSDTDEILQPFEDLLPALAPNTLYTGNYVIQDNILVQQLIRDRKVNLQLLIIYDGENNSSYISLQTYSIQKNVLRLQSTELVFVPIEPTCFS